MAAAHRPSSFVLATLALSCLWLAAPAWAQGGPEEVGDPAAPSADEAAAAAYQAHQSYCADIGSGANTGFAELLGELQPVLIELRDAYDVSGASYLLYWRGVLFACLSQEEQAVNNFRWFLGAEEQGDGSFDNLVRDSRTRLKRMGIRPTPLPPPPPERLKAGAKDGAYSGSVASDERALPAVLLGVGGGYQMTASSPYAHHYGGLAVDVSIRILRTLRIAVQARPSVGGAAVNLDQSTLLTKATSDEDRGGLSLLPLFAVGPQLWFWTKDAARPFVGAAFQFAPNSPVGTTVEGGGSPFLAGAVAFGGADIRIGSSPVHVGPSVEVGFFDRYFSLRGLVQLRVGFGWK